MGLLNGIRHECMLHTGIAGESARAVATYPMSFSTILAGAQEISVLAGQPHGFAATLLDQAHQGTCPRAHPSTISRTTSIVAAAASAGQHTRQAPQGAGLLSSLGA